MIRLSLSTTLAFGKYQGLRVSAVLRFNPSYLWWAHKNLDRVSFDDAALDAIKAECRKEQTASLDRQNAWAWGFGSGARRTVQRIRRSKIEIEHEERRKAGFTLDDRLNWIPPATRNTPDM